MEYKISDDLWNLDDDRIFMLEKGRFDEKEFISRLAPEDPILVNIDEKNEITYVNVMTESQIEAGKKKFLDRVKKLILRTGNVTDRSIVFKKKLIILKVFPELEEIYDEVEESIDSSDCESCAKNKYALKILDKMYELGGEGREIRHLKPFLPELAIKKLKGEEISTEGIPIEIPKSISKKKIPFKEGVIPPKEKKKRKSTNITEKPKIITVIGYPSRLGGADTELDHQIRIWQKLGITVQLLHTGDIDTNLKNMKMEERDCVILDPRKWDQCAGTHVISYCNDKYLKNLKTIKKYALSTTFVNCMTWLFGDEKTAIKKGLIDYNLYQRQEVLDKNFPQLKELNSDFKAEVVRPYFHSEDFPFIPPSKRDYKRFRFGRIHREDTGKFRSDTNWIYNTMVAPVLKEGVILGFNKNCEDKIGKPPDWIHTYSCGEISQQEFYSRVNVIIQPCDVNHTENLPRVAFEAMASGVPLIVDNRGGWTELVKHGETGWLCNDEREFVYYSSRMAYEKREYMEMIDNGLKWLRENWGEEKAKENWTKFFKKIGLL